MLVWFARLALGAPEICNGLDDDGDGTADEGPVAAAADVDGDGSGSAAAVELFVGCGAVPADRVADLRDCDDGRGDVFPGAPERCDGADDDCDGAIDEGAPCPVPAEIASGSAWLVVVEQVDWFEARDRCEDLGWHLPSLDRQEVGEALYFLLPGGRDFWIGYTDQISEGGWGWTDGSSGGYEDWRFGEPDSELGDEDCAELESTGQWDDQPCGSPFNDWACEQELAASAWYGDGDGDGLGDPSSEVLAFEAIPGRVRNALDCDDGDPEEPGLWLLDSDRDGLGSEPVVGCRTEGLVEEGGDCDDRQAAIHPGAEEIAGDGIDQDCDGEDVPTATEPEPTELDGDGDGLSDAEEAALGTDPTVPDTDGDGVVDGVDQRPLDPGGGRAPPPAPAYGCGCGGGGAPAGWALLLVAALGGRRRIPSGR